jgi:hypothetical protein
MTCPACDQEERQDRMRVLGTTGPLTVHRECPSGHAWHLPLVIKPETRPALRLRREDLMHPDTAHRADTAHRGRLLYIALAFLGLDLPPASQPSGLRALHAWLDTWHGIGLIEHGLARQERDLELICYGDRWGAGVYWTGHVHATIQATGWQMTP